MTISESLWESAYHVDRYLPIEENIRAKYYKTKYWKNFSHYDDYDNVDLSGLSRKEIEKLISVPKLSNIDAFYLALNPVLPSVTFSLEVLFPKTKPTFCFVRQNESYNLYLDRKKIVITEIARIFVRYDNDKFRKKTVADARYVLAETDDTAQLLIVLTNKLPDGMGKNAYRDVMAIIRKAIMMYLSIQFAMWYRPKAIYSVMVKNNKVKQLTVDESKKEELLEVIKTKSDHPAWGGPGRYRHYKDGHVVFVKPREKK